MSKTINVHVEGCFEGIIPVLYDPAMTEEQNKVVAQLKAREQVNRDIAGMYRSTLYRNAPNYKLYDVDVTVKEVVPTYGESSL